MSNGCGLTPDNILRSLPEVLRNDGEMYAIAETVANEIVPVTQETDKPRIYPRIDYLEESLLDILAWDFKVDWWDYAFSLQEKRNTLKGSWYVHKHMGTPSAVATALSAIYPDSKVEEWYTYGGEPYHFRLKIPVDQSTLDMVKHSKVLSLVSFYKNLRSILDSVEYYGTTTSLIVYPAAAPIGVHIINKGVAKEGLNSADYLVDELNEILLDELNEILLDSD